jgi:hypothetical protein
MSALHENMMGRPGNAEQWHAAHRRARRNVRRERMKDIIGAALFTVVMAGVLSLSIWEVCQ